MLHMSCYLTQRGGAAKEEYAVYEEKDAFKDKWPFGNDTFVHAVTKNGNTFLIEVKKQSKIPPLVEL